VKPKKTKRAITTPRVLAIAECARRTGVTVRTLRVYERAGLISPQRGTNGWRVYGEREVRRLNDIVTLKSLGLTLRDIRGVLSASGRPSLAEVLQLQLKALLARQASVGRAIKLVRAALNRVASNQTVSIDELCELVRSTEMTHSTRTFRELVSETIKPEEERAYLTWWATRPSEEAKSMQAFAEEQRPLFRSMEELRAEGADPVSPTVQALIERHRELLSKYRIREQVVALMEWNSELGRKYMSAGERFRNQTLAAEEGAAGPFGPAFHRYFIAATQASEGAQAVKPLIDEARSLIEQKVAPTSKQGLELGKRLRSVCQSFRLGDPAVWALSTAFIVTTERNGEWRGLDASEQAPYRFLADAARATTT
jgi:DNA-binding transcriptional MerR regulator